MGQTQLQRWHVMKVVEVGKITLKEASEKIGVSYRQAKRISSAIRERGMKALVHGNRGRPSVRHDIISKTINEEQDSYLLSIS